MTREYLDKEFMLEFIDKGANALRNSREVSFEKKRELLPKIDKAIEFFNIELIEESEAKTVVKDLAKDVVFAIDKLEIIKNSTEYTFTSSINMAVAMFSASIKNNPKEQARFDKQTAKRDKIISAGKDPATVCGTVHNIGRAGAEAALLTLGELRDTQVDMFTTVFVGNADTKLVGGRMVTPRGYREIPCER